MYFDERAVGDDAGFSRTVTEADVALFARITGNLDPSRVDEGAA